MSLLRDYLETTTLQARKGREGHVPPMLRKDPEKGLKGLQRLLPVMGIFFVVLLFSGYIFKASFKELMAQPQGIALKSEVQAMNPGTMEGSSDPAPLNKPSLQEGAAGKQGALPVKVEQVKVKPADGVDPVNPVDPAAGKHVALKKEKAEMAEPIQRMVAMAEVKEPQRPMAEYPSQDLAALQKIQAAMEEKKPEKIEEQEIISEDYSNIPSVAGVEDYFNLGLAAQKRGELNQAVLFYQKGLNLKPDHSRSLLNLSSLHIKMGNNGSAMAILKKLHIQEPENVDAMVNLGILFLHEKNYDRAEDLFQRALNLDKNNTMVLFNLAYLNQMQNRLEVAKELYNRVSSIDRENTRAFLAAASIMEKQKNFSHALECYFKCLNTKEVKNSEPFRFKIESRIRVLQQIKADA